MLNRSLTNVTHEGNIVQEDDGSSYDNSLSTQIEPEIDNAPSASTSEPSTVIEKPEIETRMESSGKKR